MTPTRRRRPLTLEAIVAASIDIADRSGLPAVSIRSVAAELNARPMSLYTFIDSKDDLVQHMLDAVLAEMLLDDVPDDWRAALLTIAHRTVEVGARHPWIVAASVQSSDVGANRSAHGRQTLEVLTGRGIEEDRARSIAAAIDMYTIGFATLTRDAADREPGADGRGVFDRGLDWLLDGFEQEMADAR